MGRVVWNMQETHRSVKCFSWVFQPGRNQWSLKKSMFKDGFKTRRMVASSDQSVKEKFNLGNEIFLVSGEDKASVNHTNDSALQNARCVTACARQTKVGVLRLFKEHLNFLLFHKSKHNHQQNRCNR